MKQRVGFVGVGLMGGWLARHLLSAGFSVTAHDIDPAKVKAIVEAGGEKAKSPDRIAAQALASEISKGRGQWDSSDIISFYDALANI